MGNFTQNGVLKMAMIKCGECGSEVSSKAKICQKCGAAVPAGLTVAKVLIPIIIVLAVWQISKKPDVNTPTAEEKKTQFDNSLIARGREAVLSNLKDPESAKFGQTYISTDKNGVHYVCGTVNTKNGFGGMTGFQPFISLGSTQMTWLPENSETFAGDWNKYCAGKQAQ